MPLGIVSFGQMGSSDLNVMESGGDGVGSPIGDGKMGQNGQNGIWYEIE